MIKKLSLLGAVSFATASVSFAQTTSQADTVVTKSVELDEVVVRAMLVKHDAHSDEYRMIPKLTEGAASAYDVLSRLPGVTYNNILNSISVRMDRNVLIEVDGHRVSQEYVQALPVERISRIQVIYAPSARYTTEGIRYVINIKLKNDYAGHGLYVGNYTMISAGDNNGSDVVCNEQPKVQYMYSSEKVDVTAGYGFAAINWNYPVSYSRNYNGIASLETADVGAKKPKDHNSTLTHAANLGIDWQMNACQTLSFRSTFQKDNVKHHSFYDVTQHCSDADAAGRYSEQSVENSKSDDVACALYYQGMFHNGWSIYSALGYDRMRESLHDGYRGNSYADVGDYRMSKDYFRGEVDLNCSFNDALSLNIGYRGIWNRYMSHVRNSNNLLSENTEGRHNGYAFLDWSVRADLLLHVGSGLEYNHKSGLGQKRDWLEFLPQLTATWQPSDQVQFMADYSAKMEYPSLYQVSVTPSALDKWLFQSGNPRLSPSRLQTVSLQGTFFEALALGAEYTHTHNAITDWYEESVDDKTFLKTFTNASAKGFRAFAAYEWAVTKCLTWNNIVQWQWQKISGHGFSNHTSNLSWRSNVEYWIKPVSLLAKVEYTREMQKDPLLQGRQEYGQDLWQASLRRGFLNKSLFVSLNYVPPIHLGIRTNQESCISTSFFRQSQKLNLNTYDNLLMLRVEWRFNKGRSKQRRVQEYEFDTERRQDKGLL